MPRKSGISSRYLRLCNSIWRACVLTGVIATTLLGSACFLGPSPISYFVIYPGPFPGPMAPAGGLPTPSSVTLNVNDKLQLSLIQVIPPAGMLPSPAPGTLIPAGSQLIDLTGQTPWFSSARSVADVDSRGLVTALAAGSTDVFASALNTLETTSIKIVVQNPNADVSVSSANSNPTTVQDGSTATVSGVVNNAGPGPATNTVVRVTYSSPVNVSNPQASQGSCPAVVNPTTAVDCNLGTLAPGASATVTLPMLLGAGNIPSVTFNFNATTSANDTNPANNTGSGTTIVVQPLTLSASALACAVGAQCSAAASATGGKPPYTFSATGLPGWATMTTAGVITGMPPDGAGGNPLINVLVQDSTVPSFSVSQSERMNVLEIQGSTTLVSGIEGRSYSDLRAVVPDLNFFITAVTGVFPPGVTRSIRPAPNGALLFGGTPTQAGSFTFTVELFSLSAVGVTVTKTFTVTIEPPPAPLVLNAADMHCAVGAACTQGVSATGGVPPYTFSAQGLPGWATLNPATGAITGTPPDGSGGSSSVQISVSDADSPAQTASATVKLNVLEILGISPLRDGFVGRDYQTSFLVTGAFGLGSYSVVGGSLPPGLSLAISAFFDEMAGIPSQAGTFTFTLQYAEPQNSVQKQFTVTIHPGLIVQPASANIKQGATQQLQAFALLDLSGTQVDVTAAVVWSSDNPNIADVSNASGSEGQVLGKDPSTSAGPTVLIRAMAQTEIAATALITVTKRDVDAGTSCSGPSSGTNLTNTEITVTCDTTNLGTEDAPVLTQTFTVTGAGATLNKITSPGSTCVITSATEGRCIGSLFSGASAQSIAEVTGLSPGLIELQEVVAGLFTDPVPTNNSSTVSIPVRQVQSIAVTPANPTVQVGQTALFTAMGTLDDGSTVNLTLDPGLTWSSSDPATASISNGGPGEVKGQARGVALGMVTITATLTSAGVNGSTGLTVDAAPSPPANLCVDATTRANTGDMSSYPVDAAGFNGTSTVTNPGINASVAYAQVAQTLFAAAQSGSATVLDSPLVAYARNAATCALTLLDQTSVPASGASSIVVVPAPLGFFVYVGDGAVEGGVHGFFFDTATSTFSVIPGFPILSGLRITDMALHPGGQYLALAVRSEGVQNRLVLATGGLSLEWSTLSPTGLKKIGFSRDGMRLSVLSDVFNSLLVSSYDPTTGLSLTQTLGLGSGIFLDMAIEQLNDGRDVFTIASSDIVDPTTNTLQVRLFDPVPRTFSAAPGSPFSTPGVERLAGIRDTQGQSWLFLANSRSNIVETWQMDLSTGAISNTMVVSLTSGQAYKVAASSPQ